MGSIVSPASLIHTSSPSWLVKHVSMPYNLHHIVGSTVHGNLWYATQLDSTYKSKPVAIKVSTLTRMTYQSEENVEQEGDIWATIPLHRHLGEWIANCQVDSDYWLVVRWYPHGDLFRRVLQLAPFPANVARSYFLQLISAVEHLHQHEICHLDISLENIMLDAEGQVRLIDLGSARPFMKGHLCDIPFRGGKSHYWCPEFWHGAPYYGPHADLFACGVILWSLLTGEFPFERADLRDPRYALLATQQLTKLLAGCFYRKRIDMNKSAKHLLYRLMSMHQEDRITTINQIKQHPWCLQ